MQHLVIQNSLLCEQISFESLNQEWSKQKGWAIKNRGYQHSENISDGRMFYTCGLGGGRAGGYELKLETGKSVIQGREILLKHRSSEFLKSGFPFFFIFVLLVPQAALSTY